MNKIKIVSIYANTDENYQEDKNKIFFSFWDENNQNWYKGAITYENLFELLKHLLKKTSE
jgi:hypothetical protein